MDAAVERVPLNPVPPGPLPNPRSNHAIESLLASAPAIRRGDVHHEADSGLPSGYRALDEALPGGGWARGAVTELLCESPGIGELSLLLPTLRALTAERRWVALVAPPHVPYAPALANAGIALERLLVVQCDGDTNALWAAELLLREGVVSALALWVERTTPTRQRRLQLAAATGDALAFVYRSSEAREEHSPVSARLALSMKGGKLELDILKLRGGRPATVLLDPATFDDAQGAEWPLAQNPAATARPEPEPAVARPPCARPERPRRFTVVGR